MKLIIKLFSGIIKFAFWVIVLLGIIVIAVAIFFLDGAKF